MRRFASLALSLAGLAAMVIPGSGAASDSTTFTAPYDTGWVCYKLIYPVHQSTCAEDVDAMRTGVLAVGGTRVLSLPALPDESPSPPSPPEEEPFSMLPEYSDPVWTPHIYRSAAASRFAVPSTGTLTAMARIDGLQIDDNAQVCVGFVGLTSTCSLGEELLRLMVPDEVPGSAAGAIDIQHSARILNAGTILIFVSVEKQYKGLATVVVKQVEVSFSGDS